MKILQRIILLLTIIFVATSFITKDLNEYGRWLKFHNLKDEDFKQVGKEGLIAFDWKLYDLDATDKLYDSLYFYSEDSAYFLDLDSYSVMIEKDAKGKLTWGGGDPESKVQLVKTKSLSATTLLFFGTDEYSETALWRNKSLFEVYGFEITKNIFTPVAWKFDLTKKTLTKWESQKKFKTLPKSYLQVIRLKNIKMRE